jgi:hypothetical protein
MNVNESLQIMYEDNPISAFSVYSQVQVDFLIKYGDEISISLAEAMDGEVIDGKKLFNDVYGMIWLWILGAYEVTRTMDEASECFTDDIQPLLKDLKIMLAKIRMPMTKQLKRGRNELNSGEPSISASDIDKKDIAFTVDGEDLYFREMYSHFKSVMSSIKLSNIKKSFSAIYKDAI